MDKYQQKFLNQQISRNHLEKMCLKCLRKWRELPPHLGLEGFLDNYFDHQYIDEREKRYDLLTEWRYSKGDEATYKALIRALLEIDCKDDAEFLFQLIKPEPLRLSTDTADVLSTPTLAREPVSVKKASATSSISATTQTVFDPSASRSTSNPRKSSSTVSKQPLAAGKNPPTAIEDLDEDTRRDLRQQLEHNRRSIQGKYASFVVSLYGTVREMGVSVDNLRLYLLGLRAFENEQGGEQPIILDGLRGEIESANAVVEIFEALTTDYCSYIDISIFQSIIEHYIIDAEFKTELQYSKHLEAYLKYHKISEYMMVNPRFRKIPKDSEKLTVTLDIGLPDNINKVLNLKTTLAGIWGLKPSTLKLAAIEKGSVVVFFLIPIPVATCIFSNGLTAKQEADIRALSVLRLECGDYTLEEVSTTNEVSEDERVFRVTVKGAENHRLRGPANLQLSEDGLRLQFISPDQQKPAYWPWSSCKHYEASDHSFSVITSEGRVELYTDECSHIHAVVHSFASQKNRQ